MNIHGYDVDKLFALVSRNFVFVAPAPESGWSAFVRCDGVFSDSRDAEYIPPESTETLFSLSQLYGRDGIIAWVANRRCMSPVKPLITTAFIRAMDEINGQTTSFSH